MDEPRATILRSYAEWTALSALRAGAPIKSREDVYPLLRGGVFDEVIDAARGAIDEMEFDAWHERACAHMLATEARLQTGWATKVVNVYLKTYAYIGGGGRAGLAAVIHPPIGTGLWLGFQRRFATLPDITRRTNCVKRIKDIKDYRCYRTIIEGSRMAAGALGCTLIEVEQLWVGSELGTPSA